MTTSHTSDSLDAAPGSLASVQRTSRFYPWLCAGILVAITLIIIGAVKLGQRRHGDRSIYFYQLGDVGHPGLVNAFTAMGFVVCAAMCAVVLIGGARELGGAGSWLLAAGLMAAIGIDDLFRLHNGVAGGDIASRVVYWGVAAFLVVRLRPVLRRRPGALLVVLGFIALAASEALDLIGTAEAGTPNDTMSILEESAACFGAWCLVAAAIGLVPALLHEGLAER